jgi:hypothetical protein
LIAATLESGSGGSDVAGTSAAVGSSRDEIEKLRLDLRLVIADNRFLQEELEKKDNMLAMLTEGLREVRRGDYMIIVNECVFLYTHSILSPYRNI